MKANIIDEMKVKYSEYLEMIPPEKWGTFFVPILVKTLEVERELTEYYKKRLQATETTLWD